MGDLKSMAYDVEQAKRGSSATPQTPWSVIRGRSRIPSVEEHADFARGNLAEAKNMMGDHYNAVMSGLGAGGEPAMAGVDNRENEAENYDPPAGGRYGAWRETISDFRQNPTD